MNGYVRWKTFVTTLLGSGLFFLQPGTARANLTCADASAYSDAVTYWNCVANGAVQGRFARQTRALAMTHAAVFDAVNAIDHHYETYAVEYSAPGADPDAAAAQAAHDVLAYLFPALKPSLDANLASSLGLIPDAQSKADGVTAGAWVAARTLASRFNPDGTASDGTPASDFSVVYVPPNDNPGTYQLTPPNFAPAVSVGWTNVAPFFLNNNEQFISPGPYPLSSDDYLADFNEVKDLGSADPGSGGRSADQEATVSFWIENPNYTWNRIARQVSAANGLTVAENARLFALLNLAVADAIIAGMTVKYTYDFWRPITAIRAADTGNPAATSDPSWNPFVSTLPATFGNNRFTPAHPDYVSNHSIYSGTASTVLASIFGSDTIAAMVNGVATPQPISLASSTALHGNRGFARFSDAATECALSRIYGGIHFRKANFDGLDEGGRIARWVFRHKLEPLGENARPVHIAFAPTTLEDAAEATHNEQ
jgi:PAP2 superfamily